MNLPENKPPPSSLTYDAPHGSLHACAFKNLDEDTLLVAMEINASAAGHVFKWDWRADAYERVGATWCSAPVRSITTFQLAAVLPE